MWRRFGWIVLLGASALLAACGGGSGGSGSSGSSLTGIAKTGTFSLGFSGGSVPGVRHAWLTAYKIAFNEDANRPWDPSDSTWKVVALSTPVTFDAASAGGFIVGSAAGGVIVPAGTYNQIRLFLSPYDDTASLPTVAEDDGTTKALTFKAQLDYDAGTAAPNSVPIEIPNVNTGLRLDRGVVIEPNNWSVLTVHMDVDRTMVRFDGGYGTADAVTFRPRTFTHGVSSSAGLINGAIDPKYVCGTAARASDPSAGTHGCVSDIVVSAFAPSDPNAPGSPRMENWQTVRVRPTITTVDASKSPPVVKVSDDGTFVLGPFSPTGGNPSQFDVVIRGTGMQPMVFKDVAYGAALLGTYLGCTWSSNANSSTRTGQTFIRPVLDTAASRSVALAPPSTVAQRVGLGFALSDRPVYELFNGNTDPFTGALVGDAALTLPSSAGSHAWTVDFTAMVNTCASATPVATGDLVLDDYVSFTDNALSEYKAYALGTFYTNPKVASASYSAGSVGTTFSVEDPSAVGPDVGTVDVTLNGFNGLAGGINKVELIASDVGGIVQTQDVSSCLTASSPCQKKMMLPALAAATSANGAAAGVYEFAVRYWNNSTPLTSQSAILTGGTMKWARSSTFVNLRSASTGAVTITAP